MKYKLTYLTDPYRGLTVDFDQNVISAGRAAENDLVVEEPHISGFHARLVQRDGRVFVEDLGSTNGTFVNGKRVKSPVQLTPGAVVQLGTQTQISFMPQGNQEVHTVVAAPAELPDYIDPKTEAQPKPKRDFPLWIVIALAGAGLLCVASIAILLSILR